MSADNFFSKSFIFQEGRQTQLMARRASLSTLFAFFGVRRRYNELQDPARHDSKSIGRQLAMFYLLLIAGIELNPGPALRSLWQPDLNYSIQQALPTHTPGDGHCLIHAIKSSLSTYLNLNISLTDIINYAQQELLSNENDHITLSYPQTQHL
jgi:hypothetical protein